MTTALQSDAPKTLAASQWLGSLRRFTVDEYQRMIEAGILADGERVELLEGWIVRKMGQNPPHSSVSAILTRMLIRLLPDSWTVRCLCPLTLSESVPEPDIAIVRGPGRTYRDRHPTPADCPIVIEVAESSIRSDRKWKTRMYAEAKIPEYWIVNVLEGVVECHANPVAGAAPRYRNCVVRASDDVLPVVLDGVTYGELAVKDFLA